MQAGLFEHFHARKKARSHRERTIHSILKIPVLSIFPYVGITQIRYDRSKFDYFLSACFTSSLLWFSITLTVIVVKMLK